MISAKIQSDYLTGPTVLAFLILADYRAGARPRFFERVTK